MPAPLAALPSPKFQDTERDPVPPPHTPPVNDKAVPTVGVALLRVTAVTVRAGCVPGVVGTVGVVVVLVALGEVSPPPPPPQALSNETRNSPAMRLCFLSGGVALRFMESLKLRNFLV